MKSDQKLMAENESSVANQGGNIYHITLNVQITIRSECLVFFHTYSFFRSFSAH